MRVLVINCGSSSLKFQLIDVSTTFCLAKGLIERIGFAERGCFSYEWQWEGQIHKIKIEQKFTTHDQAFESLADILCSGEKAIIQDKTDIAAIGHRVVHGGSLCDSTLVDDSLLQTLEKTIPLAPLHNPANIVGIRCAQATFPQSKNYVVFDTGFHKTLPPKAYLYGIPEKYHTQYGIRAYGFHGISHEFVYQEAKKYLQKSDLRCISLHLGNGASVCAINSQGESQDTSMGMGPISGLMMGTRCGDIDATVLFYLMEELKLSLQEVKDLLGKKSGMYGLCGTNDARDVSRLYKQGERKAILTYDLYTYRLQKYIGSYLAVLNGADCLLFTGGIGQNDALIRSLICRNMDFFGIHLDEHKNTNPTTGTKEIQSRNSKMKILIVPTNEELQIALISKHFT